MHGVAACRGGPSISYLFFADDSLIFCKASLEEYDSLQRVFEVYEEASGQQLNRVKTSLFFSQNTKDEIKNKFIAHIMST